MLAPVILFVYNRPGHTKETLLALSENKLANQTDLIIFSDGARSDNDELNVSNVRNIINNKDIQKLFSSVNVIERDVNFGLAKSIISGVGEVLNEYENVIVLEDDLITSVDFLNYMNDCLTYYREDSTIGAISAYNPLAKDIVRADTEKDVYSVTRSCSHGWATWKNIFQNVDWDISNFKSFKRDLSAINRFNKCGLDRFDRLKRQYEGSANSWSIVFGFHLFQNNLLTVYPSNSKILNIGADGSGEHVKASEKSIYNTDFNKSGNPYDLAYVYESEELSINFNKVYSGGFLSKIKKRLKIILFMTLCR